MSVLRSAAVDEPMAWRTALADAFDAASGHGRVLVVLSDAAHTMSDETLHHARRHHDRALVAVLVTAGRAADVLAGAGARAVARGNDDDRARCRAGRAR